MNFRRAALVTLGLGAAISACNNDNINNSSISATRFQALANSTDTLMLDTATGDLWRLDENPGDEGAQWVRYANAPTDVKSIDPDQVLHPPAPPEDPGDEPPAEPQDEPQDGDS